MKLLFVALFFLALAAGAKAPTGPNDAGPRSAPSPKETPPKKAPGVTKIDSQGLKALLKESRGQVLFLNFWATWCRPCLREYPDLIKAARRYGEKGVKVVAISMDSPDRKEAVRQFVDRHPGPIQVFQGGFGQEAQFIEITEPAWTGSLPATVFYDRSGARAFTHVGALDSESLNGAIESLLLDGQKQ
jgi:thiol-disulfide isomerase/thioredoxin